MSATMAGLLAAIALAVGLGGLWRVAAGRARALEAERDALLGERSELATRLSQANQARKKQAEELASFRKRADKVRKRTRRAEKNASDLPLGTAARLADLEAEIERVERERDRSRAEREQLAQQVARLEARLADAERPAPVAPAPPIPSDSPSDRPSESPADGVPGGDSPGMGGAGDALLRAQLAEALERVGKLEEALEQAKQTEARMRKRSSNQEQLYASLRAELDVKKDRLRAQEEKIQRLEAMKAVASD